jgi:hypothetical protein
MTLLLLRMQTVGTPYSERTLPRADDRPTDAQINRLAPDFANVKERATKIAIQEIEKSTWWKGYLPAIGAALIASIIATLTISLAVRAWYESDVREFEAERKKEVVALDQQIRQLQLDLERLKVIERTK